MAKPPADNAFALALQGVKRSIEDQTREREDAARRAAGAARGRLRHAQAASSCASSQRCASSAAMQPVPALVIAWR